MCASKNNLSPLAWLAEISYAGLCSEATHKDAIYHMDLGAVWILREYATVHVEHRASAGKGRQHQDEDLHVRQYGQVTYRSDS